MRVLQALLWLPIALAAASASSSRGEQAPDDSPPPPPPPDTTRLVDVLSQSADHTLLLAAFQHARLIPLLNSLNGSTFFAPTNKAIRNERRTRVSPNSAASVWADVVDLAKGTLAPTEHDNLQLALRDTLLYHLLNHTIVSTPATNVSNSTKADKPLPVGVPILQETLYFPSLSSYNESFPAPPTLPGTEPDRPDPDSHDEHSYGLLRGDGQRLRLVRRSSTGFAETRDEIWIGVDWKGEGGSRLAEPVFATNGAFFAAEAVLHKPDDLGESLSFRSRRVGAHRIFRQPL